MTHIKTETKMIAHDWRGCPAHWSGVRARLEFFDTTYTADAGVTVKIEQSTCYDTVKDEHTEYSEPRCEIETRDCNGDRDTTSISVEEAKVMIEIMQKFIRISEMHHAAKAK